MKNLIIPILILWAQVLQAGPWLLNEGSGKFINTFRYQNSPLFQFTEWNPYLEYGVYDKLTLVLNTGLRNSKSVYNDKRRNSLEYSELSAKVPFYREYPFYISAQALVGQSSKGFGFTANGSVAMSELRLMFGLGLKNFFSTYESAIRTFYNEAGTELRNELLLGLKFTEDWNLTAQIFHTKNLRADFQQMDYNATQFQLALIAPLSTSTLLQLGVSRTFQGDNIELTTFYMLGVWFLWDAEHEELVDRPGLFYSHR